MTNQSLSGIIVKHFALHRIIALEGHKMFEKNLKIGYLLDFYGELLTERKRSVMDMYYNEDLSLAEIASEIGISRQGARDIIKKCEDELLFYEEKLGLAGKLRQAELCASELSDIASKQSLPDEIQKKISELLGIVKL